MIEFLETSVDKFIFRVATDRFYSGEGVWAKEENGHVRIGLSDFVQQRSGDVAFAEIKPAGTKLALRGSCGHRNDQGQYQPRHPGHWSGRRS